MKATDFKDGVLFTVGTDSTVIRFCEWRSEETGHVYRSIERIGNYENRYSLNMSSKSLCLFAYIGGARLSGNIPFAKCKIVSDDQSKSDSTFNTTNSDSTDAVEHVMHSLKQGGLIK